jgi:hypothetical protein
MKRYLKLLMIWMMVLIGAALFTSSDASAIIVGTAPAATVGTTIVRPIGLPLGLVRPPIGLPLGLVRPPIGLSLGLVRPPIFNPFLIRPIFNPFLNPFIDLDDLGIPLGLGVNPGFVD